MTKAFMKEKLVAKFTGKGYRWAIYKCQRTKPNRKIWFELRKGGVTIDSNTSLDKIKNILINILRR